MSGITRLERAYMGKRKDFLGWNYQIAKGNLDPGNYRLALFIRGEYAEAKFKALQAFWKLRLSAAGYREIIVFHYAPERDTDGKPQWQLVVKFTVPMLDPSQSIGEAGLDPKGLLALSVLIVAVTLGLMLAGSNLERLAEKPVQAIQEVGGTIRDTTSKVFNPAALVLIVAAIALLTGAFKMKG